MLPWKRTVAFVNARVVTTHGLAASIRFDSRVLSLDAPPESRDAVVDLDGAFVLPGLINAHDHLELNHYGPLKRRARYQNAKQWIDDLRPVIRDDPEIRAGSAHPLADRLFIGGLKNLLSGVTTVAHHNPRYREIDRHVPTRVVKRYGWAHSFSMADRPVGANGEPGGVVAQRCAATPRDAPFIVHAGEGTDESARQELVQLNLLGCLRPSTVVVHGVAMGDDEWSAMRDADASLVWCPASNEFLFGKTAPVTRLLQSSADAVGHIAVGTDSRLTGSRDLLDELRRARTAASVSVAALLDMVTSSPARMLRLPEAGRIESNVPADLIVIPAVGDTAGESLLRSERSEITLVMVGGLALVGAAQMRSAFEARCVSPLPGAIDGVERLFARHLARRIARSPIVEPGVQITSS